MRDGGWSTTSECVTEPGPGYGQATRECNNPPPDGGKDCTGPLSYDCLIVHRQERGNPRDYFEKTFREYQGGFQQNGE